MKTRLKNLPLFCFLLCVAATPACNQGNAKLPGDTGCLDEDCEEASGDQSAIHVEYTTISLTGLVSGWVATGDGHEYLLNTNEDYAEVERVYSDTDCITGHITALPGGVVITHVSPNSEVIAWEASDDNDGFWFIVAAPGGDTSLCGWDE